MTKTKLLKELNAFLSKLGDITIAEFIDYYYQENPNGALGWKVRETLTLSKLIEISPEVSDTLTKTYYDMRDVLKFLSNYNGKPLRINVRFEDTYKKYKEEHDKHRQERETTFMNFGEAMSIYTNPYFANKLYTFK